MTLLQPIRATAQTHGSSILIRGDIDSFDPKQPHLSGLAQTIATDLPIAVYAGDAAVRQRLIDWTEVQGGSVQCYETMRQAVETIAADPAKYSALVAAPSENGMFGATDCDIDIFFGILGQIPVIFIDETGE
jgi:hypothetical protein